MQELAHPQLAWLVHWIQQYPLLTNLFIFSVALLESLVLIGISVPGAALMIAFGALIALGYLDFATTMLLCIGGAIAGDGISFWIGHRYQEQLKQLWPFRHFKSQIRAGEDFFRRHGGKSVVFGRFVGPVRAVIPTIAGMMGMTPLRFTVINVLSAIAWAPAYLFPGMVFGASLDLASEVAIRLVTLILAIVALLLLIRWLLRRIFRYLQPRADALSRRSLQWARRHRLLGPAVQSLIDPRQPESPALIFFALVLILSALGFFLLLYTLTGQPFSLDHHLHELMLSLRTPWMDRIMIGITMLADTPVISAVTVLLLLWLLYQRNIPAALHWGAAILFGAILTRVLKISLQVPRPNPDLYPASAYDSFPSAHTTMAMLLYGFMAIIISREVRMDRRIHVYVVFGLIISMIAISRIYLGAHWLTDVAGGLTLGLAWVTLLGIAYRRHPSPALPATSLIATCILATTVSVLANGYYNFEREWDRYTRSPAAIVQQLDDWVGHDWETLPGYRQDLAQTRAYPFNIQWNDTVDGIRATLEKHGWSAVQRISLRSSVKWLSTHTAIEQRPILPQVHQGQHEQLAFAYYDKALETLYVLRLWPANASSNRLPIWLGEVTPMSTRSFLHLFHYPVTVHDFRTPLELLTRQLASATVHPVRRDYPPALQQPWGGRLLLIGPAQ